MVTVHVQPLLGEQAESPVSASVPRAALTGLNADCTNLGADGATAFWVDSCADPVVVWLAVAGTGPITVTLEVEGGATEQRPDDVFALFDEFEDGADWDVVGGDATFGPDGFHAVGPTALNSTIEQPPFKLGTVLVADVSGSTGSIELGCGVVTDLGTPRQSSGWSIRWMGSDFAIFRANVLSHLPFTAPRAAANRFEVGRSGSVTVDGVTLATSTDNTTTGFNVPVVVVGGTTVVKRVFLRPSELRITRVDTEMDTDTDTDTDTDVDTDTDTDSGSVGLVADPGCRCDGGGGGGVWVGLLAALAARRRRLSAG